MSYLAPLFTPMVVAFGTALILTPVFRRLALALGMLDRPGSKKIHHQPTPLLGGPAIAMGLTAGLLVAGPLDPVSATILVAGGLILFLGIHDDLDSHAEGISWWLRLLFQGFLAVFVIYPGITLGFLRTPWLSIPFILLWIVGITNAFNLLDNMNGLSAGVAAIASLTFAVLAARYIDAGPEQLPTARAAASLAGACLGFLPWNFRSRIFMGDAGSLFIGFTLACLAALGSWRSPTLPTSVIIPLLVLAYPIFDTTLVVVLRLRRGQSPVVGGRDHSSHRLVNLGLGQVEAVLLIYLFSLSNALTALLVSSVTLRLSLLALAGSATVLFIFGMVLRKAPVWTADGLEEGKKDGQETR
ncbi:MAG TPA: MraY family glycosyltransferase [Candidatus Methylomirabilis sp.]|nr:MraY family glycosyltransferase [Candidatus Methylomirabilis sp.]